MSEISPVEFKNVCSVADLKSTSGIAVYRGGIDLEELGNQPRSLMLAARISPDLFEARSPSRVTGYGGSNTEYISSGEELNLRRRGREIHAVIYGSIKGYFGMLLSESCELEDLADNDFPSSVELFAGDYIAIAPGGECIISRFEDANYDHMRLTYTAPL